jgi:Outer membrane protein beta-barrel domain
MRLFNTVFLLLILLQTTHSAQAENFTASIDIGSASADVNINSIINKYAQLSPSSSISSDSNTLIISFGYTLDDYLSIGADLLISGSITASESGTKYKLFSADTLSIYARMGTSISPRFSIFGKLGMHVWSLSENLDSPGGLDDGVDLTYGVGTNINLYGESNRQLQIQWNHYEYNGVYVNSQDVVSIGILFLF